MLPRERLDIIRQMAIKENSVCVSTLSEKLGVRKETIRKDLDKLVEQNLLIRSYGGAILNIENISLDNGFYKMFTDSEKNLSDTDGNKNYIVKKAIDFIKEGITIMADSSPKVLEILKLIKHREDVTVISNSISLLNELGKTQLKIISTGGKVNSKLMSFQGKIVKDSIKNYNVDIALMDCNGIDINNGMTDLDEEESEIKRLMINQANKVILLADSTKYDKTSFVRLFDYKDIDCIITDIEPEIKWRKLLKIHNIDIHYENANVTSTHNLKMVR